MFSRDELLAQALRRYPDYLRAIVEGAPFFPLYVRIGKTRRAETYAERAAELAEFRASAESLNITVEWRTVNDPRFGPHERPERAGFTDEAAFLGALGKAGEVRAFRENVVLIRTECPKLETWLAANTKTIIEYHANWLALLRTVRWFNAHPRPNLYLRQIPVEGVDTKFFERQRAVLDSLFLHTQPGSVDAGATRFEQRHGLRWEEPLVRLRFLDTELQSTHGFPVADLAVPAPTFRQFAFHSVTVIITENLRNFLVLPKLPNSIALLGSGDAAALLAGAQWLAHSRILYWGDMDVRGFAILSRLRSVYPSTESVLMDSPTLDANLQFTTTIAPVSEPVPGLTTTENTALERLCKQGLWLEQERVPMAYVEAILMKLITPTSHPFRQQSPQAAPSSPKPACS